MVPQVAIYSDNANHTFITQQGTYFLRVCQQASLFTECEVEHGSIPQRTQEVVDSLEASHQD
jgi:hypothetical protein